MTATVTSKRAVFRTIAEHPDYHWPYYRLPETEYTAADLGALEHDVHRLASAWFKHDAHDGVEAFICWCPLYHLDFDPHDAHPTWHAQSKPVVPMIRALMLMDLHGWSHETAFAQYLEAQPDLVDALGFEQRPDQATLWRARYKRFSDDLLDAIGEPAPINTIAARVMEAVTDDDAPRGRGTDHAGRLRRGSCAPRERARGRSDIWRVRGCSGRSEG